MSRALPCLLVLVVAACGSRAPTTAQVDFAALDLARHGHRIERLGDTLVAFGGFAGASRVPDRGTRQVSTFALPSGPWTARADMGAGHAFFGSGVLDGRLFAVGTTLERHDPVADRWHDVPLTRPVPKSHFATAVWRGRLHVLGGYPVEAAGHLAIDPATGRVEEITPPPGFTPSDHFHLLAVLDGRLHAVGGLREGGSKLSRAHDAFDGETWAERAAPPTELWAKFAAYATIGDTLYVFSREGAVAYDARADAWRRVKPLPIDVVMPATVVLDGRIVVIGGRPLEEVPRAVQVYDPAADRWSVHRRR